MRAHKTRDSLTWGQPLGLSAGAPQPESRVPHVSPVLRDVGEALEQYRHYLLDETGPVNVNVGWGKISFQDHVAYPPEDECNGDFATVSLLNLKSSSI